eukprot:Protomagalhaensia_sp_Gyna_25__388@NODE_1184_length_2087_cov_131_413574_g941_i0_p1_GENE_NODE_1184_length_2087_cov_131_413574_g941_i0NODE_1184_length_2087_cov_131_413574_g941_i0_p1_ORF_typecomplete_len422_score59_76Cyclin/PF08613_11/1_2e24Cyclin_N/PF00134_23/1_2e06_NODE_1184_length_2087_cov_131_413574_g941_i06921957
MAETAIAAAGTGTTVMQTVAAKGVSSRPAMLSQTSTCSVSTATGSASSDSDCGLSPPSSLSAAALIRPPQSPSTATTAQPSQPTGDAGSSTSVSSTSSDCSPEPATSYGPVRKSLPPAAQPLPLTVRLDRTAKPRYNHLENAVVFVAMASRLLTNKSFCIDKQPHSVFRAEPEDPPIKHLKRFAERLSEAMRCKYPCYVLALIYLDQVSKRCSDSIVISLDTFQRLVVAAIVVAAKFYDDLYFSNDHYSKELGFSLEVVNTLEVCFLVLLDFNLRVCQEDFKSVLGAFDQVRVEVCASEGSPVWSGLQKAALPCDVASVVAAEYRVASSCGQQLAFSRPHPKWLPIHRYLAARQVRGTRFESEEEFLFKTALTGRSKVVHKLIQQHHEEVKRAEQENRSKQKLPYNLYARHYLMLRNAWEC